MAELLRSVFAGSFYPSDPRKLRGMVQDFLKAGPSPVDASPGMVVPHAGYVYSGRTAGHGFAAAPDGVETVIVCAPSHRFPIRGATVFDVRGVETPLGICPVNRDLTAELAAETGSELFPEHSFEVMVPFIQVRWPGASIVPLILGMDPDCLAVAEMLFSKAPEAFMIASSDLSHFHRMNIAEKLDRLAIEGFLSLDPSFFGECLSRGGEACGRHPILTLIHLSRMKGFSKAVELDYSTSADSGAGTEEVVGYFAGMVTQ